MSYCKVCGSRIKKENKVSVHTARCLAKKLGRRDKKC